MNSNNTNPDQTVIEVDVGSIRAGRFQPRQSFDHESLEELASSIREEGLAQPILLRKVDDRDGIEFEIVAGERRWRAFRLLGKKTIPALVRALDDRHAAILAIVENIQRQNLSQLEEAYAFKRMIEELGMTQQEIADKVGRSRPAVANILRLLSLDKGVLYLLRNQELDASTARLLLALPRHRQTDVANMVVKRGMSMAQCNRYVEKLLAQKDGPAVIAGDESTPQFGGEEETASAFVQKLESRLPEGVRASNRKLKDGSHKISFYVSEGCWEKFEELISESI